MLCVTGVFWIVKQSVSVIHDGCIDVCYHKKFYVTHIADNDIAIIIINNNF